MSDLRLRRKMAIIDYELKYEMTDNAFIPTFLSHIKSFQPEVKRSALMFRADHFLPSMSLFS